MRRVRALCIGRECSQAVAPLATSKTARKQLAPTSIDTRTRACRRRGVRMLDLAELRVCSSLARSTIQLVKPLPVFAPLATAHATRLPRATRAAVPLPTSAERVRHAGPSTRAARACRSRMPRPRRVPALHHRRRPQRPQVCVAYGAQPLASAQRGHRSPSARARGAGARTSWLPGHNRYVRATGRRRGALPRRSRAWF